jgi:hypothetical protein
MASALLRAMEGDFTSVTFLEGEGVAQAGA